MTNGNPTNFKNIILAMDLALSQPGFAVLATVEEGGDNKPILLETSFVTTNGKDVMGKRLCDIEDEIARLILAYSPQFLVREKGFSRFAATTQALFRVTGISDRIAYVAADKPISELSPTSVKKIVTGDGRASKQDVATSVFFALQITNTDEFYRTKRNGELELIDDKTDACAVGLAFMKEKGMIEL